MIGGTQRAILDDDLITGPYPILQLVLFQELHDTTIADIFLVEIVYLVQSAFRNLAHEFGSPSHYRPFNSVNCSINYIEYSMRVANENGNILLGRVFHSNLGYFPAHFFLIEVQFPQMYHN